jgi:hypothetical protein
MTRRTLEEFRLLMFFLILIALVLIARFAKTDTYAPADSVSLSVGCLDTTFLNVADADSVWFKWFRVVGAPVLVDSAKVTTFTRTGFAFKNVKASDNSNNFGNYMAEAVVYKQTKSGIKTWSWTVKADFDSTIQLLKAEQQDIGAIKDTAHAGNIITTAIKGKTDSLRFDDSNYVKSSPFALKGSPETATNLRYIFDGDSTTRARADFAQVTIFAQGTNSHAVWKKGNGNGYGEMTEGGATGGGAYWKGFGSGKYGWEIISAQDNAVNINGYVYGVDIKGRSDGLVIEGTEGDGVDIYGHDDGIAIYGDELATGDYDDINLRTTHKIRGTFDDEYGFWHSIALASDSGGGIFLISASGNVVDSTSNSSSEFKTDLTNAVNGHYDQQLIIFTSGTNAGQVRIITDYIGDPKYIKLRPAFEVEPAVGDDFKILYLLGREMGIKKILE